MYILYQYKKQYTWAQLRESYKGTIDSELKTFNEDYRKFIDSKSKG